MNKQTARNLLMDYLYDEISAADKEKLEAYLANHPEMQQELDELQVTRRFLQHMSDEKVGEKILLVEPETSRENWWSNARKLLPQSGWGRTAFAAAACVLLLLVVGSLMNLNIRSTQTGFAVHLGYGNQPQSASLSNAQTEAIIKQVRKENTAILTEYADMLNKHNQQQLQQVVEYFQNQREQDLTLINQNLKQVRLKGQYRWAQTNQMLGELIQTASDK